MQKNAMARKPQVLVDNQELPGLVLVGGIPLEDLTIEVPEFKRIRVIDSGVEKIPPVELTYRLDRSTKTRQFLVDWKANKETHDVVIIECDAAGQEWGRILAPMADMTRLEDPEGDLASPTFAQLRITLAPWDLTLVPPQQ